MADVTQQAIEAVGTEKPTDWILKPKTHAAALPASAAALRRVLERPEISDLMTRYEAADKAAISAQNVHIRLSRWAFYCRFLAISIGALALSHLTGVIPRGMADAGLTVEYALIVASLALTILLGIRVPFETWMNNRAQAENARVDLFNKVSEFTEEAGGGELPLLPLQLEYFRRYQLDVQRLFYRQRGLQHKRAAGLTQTWRWTAVGLLVLATIPAGLGLLAPLSATSMPDWLASAAEAVRGDKVRTILLALGIVATALASLISAISLLKLDQRNAARYLSNADNLDFLCNAYLRDARAAAAVGDKNKVNDFIALVQMYISSEHREWILARDLANNLELEHFAQLRLPGRRR